MPNGAFTGVLGRPVQYQEITDDARALEQSLEIFADGLLGTAGELPGIRFDRANRWRATKHSSGVLARAGASVREVEAPSRIR